MKSNALIVSIVTVGCLAGCGKRDSSAPSVSPAPAESTPTAPAASATVDPATAGTIKGVVRFSGNAPKMTPISFAADAVCAAAHAWPVMFDTVIVNENGTLANVFVYVKSGLEKYKFEIPKQPVTLDQKGCLYTPHVQGIMCGQDLEVVNSDNTLHNVNAVPNNNAPFNKGQPVQGMKFRHKFYNADVMVKFKCDVHPWMSAHLGVLPHPCFGVTGKDGAFSLQSLPPGTYVIEAWHEKYGTIQQTVTVGEQETKEIEFEFKQ